MVLELRTMATLVREAWGVWEALALFFLGCVDPSCMPSICALLDFCKKLKNNFKSEFLKVNAFNHCRYKINDFLIYGL